MTAPLPPPRRRSTLGRLMGMIALVGLVLALVSSVWREQVNQRRLALMQARYAAEQEQLRAQAVLKAQLEQRSRSRDATLAERGPEPTAQEWERIRQENQDLKRRVQELERRIGNAPVQEPDAEAPAGLTPSAGPE